MSKRVAKWGSIIEERREAFRRFTRPTGQRALFSRFDHAWRAMRYRNFRLYLWGQGISLMGTWMTRLALSWLTYRLTHSAFLLGLVGFSGQILTFLSAPFAGVWIDRLDRRKLLVTTQALAAVQSLALAWLTLTGIINIKEILLLAMLQGLIDAFDMPGRQSFMVKMVANKADLGNAIALNSSMVNVARLVGPPAAAFIIARLNEGYCFLFDGCSYFAVIASLLLMRVVYQRPSSVHKPSMFEQMKDGWSYVSGYLPVRNILLLFSVCSLMGMPYMVLLPIFASQVLGGGLHTLGLLTAASGIGALVSAVLLAVRKSVIGLIEMIQLASAMFGLGLMAFGLSRWLWFSLLTMLITGFGMMQGLAASNTVIQTLVPEEKRGRVMSYYTVAFVGMTPFGCLLNGWLARTYGAQYTLLVTGASVLLGGIWFFSQRNAVHVAMRPRYEELGLLTPEL